MPDPLVRSPHGLLSNDPDRLLDAFEEAWQRPAAPVIEEFLPPGWPAGDPRRRDLLKELIKIEMEHRWRRACRPLDGPDRRLHPGSAPETVRLEMYLHRFPELRPAEALLTELIGEEYRARHRWGDRPRQAEYAGRFPGHSAALRMILGRIDAELASEQALVRRRAELSYREPDVVSSPSQRAAMPQAMSCASILDTLRHYRLLDQDQIGESDLVELRQRFTDPRALGKELIRRGWLTPYQVNQVYLGRGQELVLGPYLILERLGQGGMGQVFKACHLDMKRTVAIKLIRKELLTDVEAVSRFRREVQGLSQLTHPHIVHAYDAGLAGPPYFLVTEYIEGVTLLDLVKAKGPLPSEQASEYVRQAALGLHHLHVHGLVHRDIKPGNLIVTGLPGTTVAQRAVADGRTTAHPWGIVKIMDLGLARLHQPAAASPSDTTVAQVVMGTLDYMAPEQALDFHTAAFRADIYSLGCTWYFLLAGYPPFPAGTTAQKLLLHQSKEPAPLNRQDVSKTALAVLAKMMTKRPEDRYQTAGDIALALGAPEVAAVTGSVALPVQTSATASPLHLPAVVARSAQVLPVPAHYRTLPASVVVPHNPGGRQLGPWIARFLDGAASLVARMLRWPVRVKLAAIGMLLVLIVGVAVLRPTTKPAPVFLSDLTPAKVDGGLLFNAGTWRMDDKSAAKPMKVRGGPVGKGLILRTETDGITRVSYRLDKKYKHFRATVVMEDLAQIQPLTSEYRLTATVMFDGVTKWRSKLLGAKDEDVCELDVSDVVQLEITSDSKRTSGWMVAPMVWIDPCLIPK